VSSDNEPNARPVVVLVGVGEIGSRHLQGLTRCHVPLRIFGVEPNLQRVEVALDRWKQVNESNQGIHHLEFSALREVPDCVDVAIVATSATARLEAAHSLAQGRKVKSWIFEKWITNRVDELPEFLHFCAGGSQAWVNFPRRVMSWYQEINQLCEQMGVVEVDVKLRPDALFTNSIHFVDLVERWTGENVVSSRWGGVELIPTASKRTGFVDSCGQMTANFSGGSQLKVTSKSGDQRVFPSLRATWRADSLRIDEESGVASFGSRGEVVGRLTYQSELSGQVIEGLLRNQTCHLTRVEHSIQTHGILLHDINDWWRQTAPPRQGVLPIT